MLTEPVDLPNGSRFKLMPCLGSSDELGCRNPMIFWYTSANFPQDRPVCLAPSEMEPEL